MELDNKNIVIYMVRGNNGSPKILCTINMETINAIRVNSIHFSSNIPR